jgi:hypothetical protein
LELLAKNCLVAEAFANPNGVVYCPIAELINSVVKRNGTAVDLKIAFRNYLGGV